MSQRLNPIQQRIADGMSPLVAVFTEATCGEACWEAREDLCRCSCFGRNHGVMRTADGTRPQRTAKIAGLRYVLKATAPDCRVTVETDQSKIAAHDGLYDEHKRLHLKYHPDRHYRVWDMNCRGAVARIKNASKSQLNWQELTSYREIIEAIKARRHAPIEWMREWPQLLWVREDIVAKEKDR